MLYQRTIYNICNSSKTSEEIKEKLINKGIPFEKYKDERGADKASRKQRCGDCYRKI